MTPNEMTRDQVERAERVLSVGTWAITAGAVLFSVLTVTPLVERVTPDDWDWTAPILPLVVDAAVIIVVRLDAAVARVGGRSGVWPWLLRWMTGLMTLALNVGDSALAHNRVGVAVHAVAPLLLIVTAEASLSYRRAITAALAELEREERDREERDRAEAREQREREEREREAARREQQAREQQEREQRERREEREQAERLERERLEREDAARREARESEERLERDRLASRERSEEADRRERERVRREERERQEKAAREQRESADRKRQDREAREQREAEERAQQGRRAVREQAAPAPVNTVKPAPVNTVKPAPVNTGKSVPVNTDSKLPEPEALAAVRAGMANSSVRELADATGWSVGWVAKQLQAIRDEHGQEQRELAAVAGDR